MTGGQIKETVPAGGPGDARRNLLYARLMTLMQLAEDSAEIAYPRRLHMPDLSRQLIFMIGMYGSIISKDLATASGREKAQISRGLKALTEAGLTCRAPAGRAISLTARGRATFLEVMKIAQERDALLKAGFAEAEIRRFVDLTGMLIDRASSIFVADEQTIAISAAQRSSIHHPPEPGADLPRASLEEPSYRDLLLPWLQSLLTYMRRSGTTLFRREVGLSHFEWRVLSLIAENQPINLSSLIVLVSRDKSQVARIVKQLHASGLIDRRDEGRVNAALTLAVNGREAYDRIVAISAERDRFLFEGHGADRAFYLDMIDRLIANADAMLDAEESVRGDKHPAETARPEKAPAAGAVGPPGAVPESDIAEELRLLREENARLKRLLAEAILDNSRLRDMRGTSRPT